MYLFYGYNHSVNYLGTLCPSVKLINTDSGTHLTTIFFLIFNPLLIFYLDTIFYHKLHPFFK